MPEAGTKRSADKGGQSNDAGTGLVDETADVAEFSGMEFRWGDDNIPFDGFTVAPVSDTDSLTDISELLLKFGDGQTQHMSEKTFRQKIADGTIQPVQK